MRRSAAALLAVAAAACADTAAALPESAPQATSYTYTTELVVTVERPLGDLRVTGTRTGSYVAPDSHAVVSRVAGTEFDLATERVVVIGADAYYDGGDGYVATSSDDPAVKGVTDILTSVGSGLLPDDRLYRFLRDRPAGEIDRTLTYELQGSDLVAAAPAFPIAGLRRAAETAGDGALRIQFDTSNGFMTTFHLELLDVDDFFGNSAGIELDGTVDLRLTILVEQVNDPTIAVSAPATVATRSSTRAFSGPGFTLDHPADWIIAEPDAAIGTARAIVAFRPPAAAPGTEVNIVVEPTPASLDDYVDSNLTLAGDLTGFELISDEVVELRSTSSRIVEFAAGEDGERFRVAQAYVVTGTGAVIVTYRAPVDEYHRHFEMAILIIASLELQ